MSVRSVIIVVFGTLVALQVAIAFVAARMERLQASVVATQARRLDSWKLATELRSSSDELTRMARTFVVTGDPTYETYFNDILAIRNGEKPRPPGYGGIYWDFVVAQGEHGEQAGPAVSLETLMRRLDFTEAEFAKLREAQDRSDALVQLETVAMNAARGRFRDEAGAFTVIGEPDLELARDLMHGEAYHRAKAEIMRPISEFFEMLDTRTAAEVETAAAAAHNMARLTFLLTSVAAILTLLALLLLLRLVIGPIRRMITQLREVAEGDGDLTRRVHVDRQDELGELAGWFNRFIALVHDIVAEVAATSTSVAAAAAQIAATAREQATSTDRLRGSAGQVAAAVSEITASGTELSSAMMAINDASEASARSAGEGRSSLRGVDTTLRELTEAVAALSDRLQHLQERAAGIEGVVSAMVKVADQTNLLSVNAAIEAVRASGNGGGFRTVALEIRRLADEAAEASLTIENDVRTMQSAMTDGMHELGRFNTNVQSIVDRMRQVAAQLGTIIEQVQGLAGRFETVSAGMQQQTAGIRQINDAVRELDESAARSRESIREFVDAAEQLQDATATLRAQVSRFRLAARAV